MGWATFWAIFSQTRLVTLKASFTHEANSKQLLLRACFFTFSRTRACRKEADYVTKNASRALKSLQYERSFTYAHIYAAERL
jgi:hypothetical protein